MTTARRDGAMDDRWPDAPDLGALRKAVDTYESQVNDNLRAFYQLRNYPSANLDLASTQQLLDELAARYITLAAKPETCIECGHEERWHFEAGCSVPHQLGIPSCACSRRIVTLLPTEESVDDR